MKIILHKSIRSFVCSTFLIIGLSGCVSTVIGTTVDVMVEVVKVPFKVGGAVIDLVTGDD